MSLTRRQCLNFQRANHTLLFHHNVSVPSYFTRASYLRRLFTLSTTKCTAKKPTSSRFSGSVAAFNSLDATHAQQSDASLLSRFDWRLCANSRAPISPDAATKKQKYVRRISPPVALLQPDERYYDALQHYQDRFLPLIEAEQQQEELMLRERLGTWPLAKLKEEGFTLDGLSAYWLEETRFGKPVACFQLGPGVSLPEHHRFINGTQVLLSRDDPLTEEPRRGAVVSSISYQLNIAFPDLFDLDGGTWRLDIGQSQFIFEQMRKAIAAFNYDPEIQDNESFYLPTSPLGDSGKETLLYEYILHGTQLRDVLLHSFHTSDHPHIHRPLQDPDDPSYVDSSILEHESRKTILDDADSEALLDSSESESPSTNFGVFKDDMLIQSWARRYSSPTPLIVEGDPPLEGLNESQRRAMAMMIRERISLVQGPPGTGKTRTIIETIKLLKVHFRVPHPILVCTFTNVAVDNLVEGLANAKLKPLRAASAGKTKASLAHYTLDHQIAIHPLQVDFKALTDRKERVKTSLKDLNEKLEKLLEKEKTRTLTDGQTKWKKNMEIGVTKKEREITMLKKRLYGLEQRMIRDCLDKSDVICTTCITSASAALQHIDFPVVFLDEASMSTEPASLIPLMKGSQHVALIGDHKQLPPVITSPEAQSMGLGISLFERLTEEGEIPSIMLNVQYRMHPAISYFPSLEFYNLSLLDGTVDRSGYVSPRLMPPNISAALLPPGIQEAGTESNDIRSFVKTSDRPPLIFLDHAGVESKKSNSRVNENEAKIIASVVEDLLLNNETLRGQDIGIIAPYAAQVSLLTRLFNTDARYRERFRSVLGDHRAMQLGNIEIKTVDGFEGREKEVIIFSTVRNNSGGYIGFLADRRRLNVGLTRAKRGLFVIGNLGTLKQSKISGDDVEGGMMVKVGKGGAQSWKRYANYLLENGLVLSLGGDALTKVLYGNLQAATAAATGSVELES